MVEAWRFGDWNDCETGMPMQIEAGDVYYCTLNKWKTINAGASRRVTDERLRGRLVVMAEVLFV